jgi:hypothetical protein
MVASSSLGLWMHLRRASRGQIRLGRITLVGVDLLVAMALLLLVEVARLVLSLAPVQSLVVVLLLLRHRMVVLVLVLVLLLVHPVALSKVRRQTNPVPVLL